MFSLGLPPTPTSPCDIFGSIDVNAGEVLIGRLVGSAIGLFEETKGNIGPSSGWLTLAMFNGRSVATLGPLMLFGGLNFSGSSASGTGTTVPFNCSLNPPSLCMGSAPI